MFYERCLRYCECMRLFPILLFGFLAIPILEIYLLIKVGHVLGSITTIAFIVFTGVLGALLMRYQGLSNIQNIQARMRDGELPGLELLEGPVMLFGGVLLLIPGFMTDVLGLLLLFPWVRRALLLSFIARGVKTFGLSPDGQQTAKPRSPTITPNHGNTIEGEFHRED